MGKSVVEGVDGRREVEDLRGDRGPHREGKRTGKG
jgi:hypothetical protein